MLFRGKKDLGIVLTLLLFNVTVVHNRPIYFRCVKKHKKRQQKFITWTSLSNLDT